MRMGEGKGALDPKLEPCLSQQAQMEGGSGKRGGEAPGFEAVALCSPWPTSGRLGTLFWSQKCDITCGRSFPDSSTCTSGAFYTETSSWVRLLGQQDTGLGRQREWSLTHLSAPIQGIFLLQRTWN